MCVRWLRVLEYEDITMKNKNRKPNDHLTFPSGRTIKRCKEDAKTLRKSSKNTTEYISYNKALNIVAGQNGLDMSWDKAYSQIVSAAENKRETIPFEPSIANHSPLEADGDLDIFNWLKGTVRSQQSNFKKDTYERFEVDGKLMLPDGEGNYLEVVQHKARNNGILITPKIADLIEQDIEKMGGLESLKGYDDGNVQILYEKPGSNSHAAYEFHIGSDGVIHYFCRCLPWEGYEAELIVRGHSITNVGHGQRAADTALHWLSFAIFHQLMTPRAL